MCKYGHQKEDDLKEAFKVFDQDNNGYIDATELQNILGNMGEALTIEQVTMVTGGRWCWYLLLDIQRY